MSIVDKTNLKLENITSVDCFDRLSKISNSFLIDVRTKPEWNFVGVPDLFSINKNALFISWQLYPEMSINPFFEKEIEASSVNKNDKLFFLCRSGNRSCSAAEFLISVGYKSCFNIEDGFEGKKNTFGHFF